MTPVVPRHSESVSELESPELPLPPLPTWHSTTRSELDAAGAFCCCSAAGTTAPPAP
jgi:hypothetical protein